VLRFQGYRRGAAPAGPDVLALFDEALTLGRRLISPRAAVRWATVRERTGDRLRAGEVTFTIPDIDRQWGPIEQVAGAVVTIGEALERRVAELWEARELPLAVMLDSVGSGSVESLAEYVNDLLCQEALPRGLKVTNRISPGYGAWDVGEQALLLRLCPPGAIGVSVNAACFMTPTKSISLLVGAGPQARVDHYFSQCARCWMAQCAYRRAPATKTVRSS
jgi:cobalamin-dependent methionine synthase I